MIEENKKYRVVHTTYLADVHPETFMVQKKSFLGIWYNFENNDAYRTGFFDTEEEAMKCIKTHQRRKGIHKIIKYSEV